MLDAAAATDDTLKTLREQHAKQRWDGLRRFADLLDEHHRLRPGLSVDRATDIIWTVCAQANYDAS